MGPVWLLMFLAVGANTDPTSLPRETETDSELKSSFVTDDDLQTCNKTLQKLRSVIALTTQVEPNIPIQSCPLLQFIFPRVNEQSDRVVYKRYFPTLRQATLCTYIYLQDQSYTNPIISYYTSNDQNELLLEYFPTSSELRFSRGYFSYNDFKYHLDANVQYHICAWFDSANKIMGIYVNGEDIGLKGYDGSRASGGGNFLLGQDENSSAEGFKTERTFTGTQENVIVYPRVLTQVEVLRIAFTCQCPVDHVVSMTLDKVDLLGETTYAAVTQCPPLPL